MTAFPVTKLPLHPPGDTNTLWAFLGYNEKGCEQTAEQRRGENVDVRRKIEELD